MALQHTMVVLVAFVSLLVPMAMARDEPPQLLCSILPTEECAFAVDSAGQRCVLETFAGGVDWHVCQTSDIVVSDESPREYIESDECMTACGVAKMTVGLSTDALESTEFTSKLCSPVCQDNCPNLVDLFTNLAAGEGKSLRVMCSQHHHQSWEVGVHRRRQTEVYATLDAAEEPSPEPSSGS